jgi:hypothetical protein
MLGLAAIAAVAAMALIGASSATATSTQLCKKFTVSEAPTSAECERATAAHFISVNEAGTAAAHAKLVSETIFGTITIECNALISATLPAELVTNGPIATTAATLSYSNCLGGCEVKVLKQGTIKTLNLDKELADITAEGFRVLAECSGTIHCVYDATNLTGAGKGPKLNASGKDEVSYNGSTVNKVEGFLCPSTSKLFARFQGLTPTYARL